MPNFISENQIEKEILLKLKNNHNYRTLNCYTAEAENINDKSSRENKSEVVFIDILKQKLVELNKGVPEEVIDSAIEKLTERRTSLSPILANKEIYELIKDGIPVEYDVNGKIEQSKIGVIDFINPTKNDFLAVSQLWIKGDPYYRRPDIIIYINGIPLVFIELKNSNIQLKNAYDDNLSSYKKDIPLLFQYNAFCILSNAIETKVGSFTAGYEHFFNWLRPDDETEKINKKQIEKESTSVERVINGLLNKERLIDYIENFILYHNDAIKIIAQNHQFLGVNNAFESFKQRKKKKGKLGVFWHTQGAGKSFSMIFLMRKILRKITGNFTFLVITDRDDLNTQIYKNFLSTETVKKGDAAQPKNSEELREFLSLNKKIIFTLIHKFRYEKGKQYPLLTKRDDIIVFVDEAHRTQYKNLADNMRTGIPNAQYFAFTGTPLLGRERKTNEYFGDYVSEYNFVQSMDEGATKPLFYQKRVPEVWQQNENLSDEFYEILEEENLTDKQKEKLENEFSTEFEVIKRDDRLEKIAEDIAHHFPRRGYLGKGMVVSVDKFTAVKMYDKVQKFWKEEIKKLVGEKAKAKTNAEKEKLDKIIDFMRNVEMSVVVSEEADEEKKFAAQGLDIKPHRRKMNDVDDNGHDIEFRFKDPEDKFQLAFVCAMWLTGFDVPSLSTMYLDKPMQGHTLMQCIARANRVTSHVINGVSKENGEIIDYYNVFRNMKRALADYARGADGSELPVKDKTDLFKLLDESLKEVKSFFYKNEIEIEKILESKEVFKKIELFEKFADKILEKDEQRKEFCIYENSVSSLYEACKPEIIGDTTRPLIPVIQYLRGVIDAIVNQQDIEKVKLKISNLLDQSVVSANGLFKDNGSEYKDNKAEFKIQQRGKTWDLSKLDFDKLKCDFKTKEYKNIEITDLRAFLDDKLEKMINQNTTRRDFAVKLQEIIDRYNSGGMTTENFYDELVDFTSKLHEEEERSIREGLTEDELEIYDLLKKEKMTKAEEQKVKLAAKQLLTKLKEEQPRILIQDWYRDNQTRERVKARIEKILHETLPESYDRVIFSKKKDLVYDLVYDYSVKGLKWC